MLQRFIDTWTTNNYRICNESEIKQFQNESQFQQIYSNIEKANLSPKILCVVEGRWSKDNAVSVNGRFYGKFWRAQLAKEQTQYLLRKGLMYMMFGHVDRGIADKDVEDGTVAGIVTHLQVLDAPTVINGRQYEKDDLFGRAIIIEMGGKNAGLSTYTLLSVGSEISISSRGLGEYLIGETHTCEDGTQVPIMNPDTYELETFDFTRLPGISCAEVHTVRDNLVPNDMPNNGMIENEDEDFTFESLEVSDDTKELINESLDTLIFSINENYKKETTQMAKVDGIKVQQVLEEANAKIAALTAKLEAAEEERDAAVAKADELEKKVEAEAEEPENANDAVAAADEVKDESVEAGTEPEEKKSAEEVEVEAKTSEALPEEVDTTELDKFKAIADTPEELKEVLDKVAESLHKCEDDAAEIERLKAERDNLEADLKEKDNDIKEACEALESYTKLGSIAALTAMVESANKIKAEARRQQLIKFTEHYSNAKGITRESVKRIIESAKSIKDAKQILEGLPDKVDTTLYTDESAQVIGKNKALKSFAESMINKMENRRTRKYTAE